MQWPNDKGQTMQWTKQQTVIYIGDGQTMQCTKQQTVIYIGDGQKIPWTKQQTVIYIGDGHENTMDKTTNSDLQNIKPNV